MAHEEKEACVIVWFRQNLRLSDHPALAAAAETGTPVIPVFILDDRTAGGWRAGAASRWWLAQSIRSLKGGLRKLGARLVLRRGNSEKILSDLIQETGAKAVHFTRGYEPFQRSLEEQIRRKLEGLEVKCHRYGGHILFEPETILNKAGEPFRVYTPFLKAVTAADDPGRPLAAPSSLRFPEHWPKSDELESWELEPEKPDWAGGLRASWTCGEEAAQERLRSFVEKILKHYSAQRNVPGIDGTSRLSPHLAFGEISPRQIWRAVLTAAEDAGSHDMGNAYIREIVWREFSYYLLFHFPALPDTALRSEFDAFPWRKDKTALQAWQKGLTGFPIVDAGMRQLWQTGWMHNRVRMITASFLIKHLMLPWQTGEAWFWDTLVDADLANNAASWQWVAGSGADAAPYFRIFNPVLHSEKFDPDGDYVRSFCPELAQLPNSIIHKPWLSEPDLLLRAGVKLGTSYPKPIVDHSTARKRALSAFETIKKAS